MGTSVRTPRTAETMASLTAWRTGPDPRHENFPYEAVLTEVRLTGKEFVPAELLTELAACRAVCPRPTGLPYEFLDIVLDKADCRYHYETYLGLPLLTRLVDGVEPKADSVELAMFLVADLVRHETARALEHVARPASEMAPCADTVRKRLRHGVRLIARHDDLTEADALLALLDAPLDERTAAELDACLPAPADPAVAQAIDLAMLPVDTLHDEYLFLRVLQSYEFIFRSLVRNAEDALKALREGDAGRASTRLDDCSTAFRRASLLFTMLATMSSEAFRLFRIFTDGASAIQSQQYKRFELLCGLPREQRLESPAFLSVPAVYDDARRRPDTLTDAWLGARAQGHVTEREWTLLATAVTELEKSHQRWKSTHHNLALRMLGDATGSGYTSGVPYLRDCLDNRLFWGLADDNLLSGSAR